MLLFIRLFIHQLLFLGFLVIIFAWFVFDLFVRIYRIRVHWYQNLSSGVIKNCLWDVYKPYIWICFPTGLWKVVVRVPVGCSWFFLRFITLSYLKYPSIYSLKTSFIDCWLVYIISIGSEFIDPETFPRVWLNIFCGPYPKWTYIFSSPAGFLNVVVMVTFFLLQLLPSVNLLASRQFLKFEIFRWVVGDYFINITGYCFFLGVFRFINITEACSLYWGYRCINIT